MEDDVTIVWPLWENLEVFLEWTDYGEFDGPQRMAHCRQKLMNLDLSEIWIKNSIWEWIYRFSFFFQNALHCSCCRYNTFLKYSFSVCNLLTLHPSTRCGPEEKDITYKQISNYRCKLGWHCTSPSAAAHGENNWINFTAITSETRYMLPS